MTENKSIAHLKSILYILKTTDELLGLFLQKNSECEDKIKTTKMKDAELLKDISSSISKEKLISLMMFLNHFKAYEGLNLDMSSTDMKGNILEMQKNLKDLIKQLENILVGIS